MLNQFDTTKNLMFFPARWANSVTKWLTGLVSPMGTIRIENTPDPNESGGCRIDVNVDVLYDELKARIARDFVGRGELAESVANVSDKFVFTRGGTLMIDPKVVNGTGV